MKTIARITLQKPGAMTKAQRKRIANWMIVQGYNLLLKGEQYTSTGPFTARYHV
jgi:hypothetical protein